MGRDGASGGWPGHAGLTAARGPAKPARPPLVAPASAKPVITGGKAGNAPPAARRRLAVTPARGGHARAPSRPDVRPRAPALAAQPGRPRMLFPARRESAVAERSLQNAQLRPWNARPQQKEAALRRGDIRVQVALESADPKPRSAGEAEGNAVAHENATGMEGVFRLRAGDFCTLTLRCRRRMCL